ncbi:MAG: thermosome subunit alpha [Candidatus Methanospirareceae archaeon]
MVKRRLIVDETGHGRIVEEKERGKKIREGLEENITVVKNVSDVLKTSLGPEGMKKMLVDKFGEVVVTGDGSLMLEEMEIVHPAAKMLVAMGKEMRDKLGDGSTRAVILAGELMRRAENLITAGLHPTTIINGYNIALRKAKEVLDEISVDITGDEFLRKIAFTSMSGLEDSIKKKMASVVIEAVKRVTEENNGRKEVRTKNVCVERAIGGVTTEFLRYEGIVVNRDRIDKLMPKRVRNARIALLNSPIELKLENFQRKFNIKEIELYAFEAGVSPMKALLDKLDEGVREIIDKLKRLGVNVVFTRKGIDEIGKKYLTSNGILAAKRVELKYLEDLEEATGAKITDINDLCEEDIGAADMVEEIKVGSSSFLHVSGCPGKKFYSIIIRGGTLQALNELQRKLLDTIKVVGRAIESGKFVTGGGSLEMELARRLRKQVASLDGKEQIAFQAYVDALEAIPRLLASNYGMNPIDKLIELRANHEAGHTNYGVGGDMLEKGIIEPLSVEKQILTSATEVANMILRIDDIVRRKLPPGSMLEKEKPPVVTAGMLTSDIQLQQMVKPHPDTPEYCLRYLEYHPWGLWEARQRMEKPYWKEEKYTDKYRKPW